MVWVCCHRRDDTGWYLSSKIECPLSLGANGLTGGKILDREGRKMAFA